MINAKVLGDRADAHAARVHRGRLDGDPLMQWRLLDATKDKLDGDETASANAIVAGPPLAHPKPLQINELNPCSGVWPTLNPPFIAAVSTDVQSRARTQ